MQGLAAYLARFHHRVDGGRGYTNTILDKQKIAKGFVKSTWYGSYCYDIVNEEGESVDARQYLEYIRAAYEERCKKNKQAGEGCLSEFRREPIKGIHKRKNSRVHKQHYKARLTEFADKDNAKTLRVKTKFFAKERGYDWDFYSERPPQRSWKVQTKYRKQWQIHVSM